MALERAYLAGVDMNMGDYDGRTALHLACVENHPACVKYLIETCKVCSHIGKISNIRAIKYIGNIQYKIKYTG